MHIDEMNLDDLLCQCLPIIARAGAMISANWNLPHQISYKGPIDLVTETDVAVENFLREELCALLPEAAFVGEESGANPSLLNSLCWVVDPVDGTTNFAHQIPNVAVSVALCSSDQPILGIVEAPMLGERFYACRRSQAFRNGQPIHVSANAELCQALIATGFPYEVGPVLSNILDRLGRVLPATQGLRRAGSAALDLAWTAMGRLDAYYEAELKPWDMAAGWLIVQQAGGMVTNLNGVPATLGGPILASNGLIHKKMLELVG